MLSVTNLWQHLAGAAWVPWVLAAGDAALSRPTVGRTIAWGGAVALQLLAGSLDYVLLGGLAQAALAWRHLGLLGERRRGTGRRLAATAAAAALALALSAAQWVPALELLRGAWRAELGEPARGRGRSTPRSCSRSSRPCSRRTCRSRAPVRREIYDDREPVFSSIYLGVAALPFVLAGLLARPRRTPWLLLALGLLATALALGRHGLAYFWALELVPALDVFRFPAKTLVLVALAWALLAGLGFDAWAGASRGLRLAASGATLAAGLGLAFAWARGAGWSAGWLAADPAGRPGAALLAPVLAPLLPAALVAAAAAVALVARARRRAGPGARRARGDRRARARAPQRPARRCRAPSSLPRPASSRPRRPTASHACRCSTTRPGAGAAPEPTGRQTSRRPYWPSRARCAPRCRGRSTRSTARAGAFAAGSAATWRGSSRARGSPSPCWCATTRRTGSGSRASCASGASRTSPHATAGAWRPSRCAPRSAPRAWATRSSCGCPAPLPRAYAAEGARVASGRAAYAVLLDAGFDPAREVVLPAGAERPARPGFASEVRVLEDRPDRIRLEARVSRPAELVVLEGFDRGWRARVDGRAAELRPANALFLSVPLEAGHHRVELLYRPPSVSLGPRGHRSHGARGGLAAAGGPARTARPGDGTRRRERRAAARAPPALGGEAGARPRLRAVVRGPPRRGGARRPRPRGGRGPGLPLGPRPRDGGRTCASPPPTCTRSPGTPSPPTRGRLPLANGSVQSGDRPRRAPPLREPGGVLPGGRARARGRRAPGARRALDHAPVLGGLPVLPPGGLPALGRPVAPVPAGEGQLRRRRRRSLAHRPRHARAGAGATSASRRRGCAASTPSPTS